MPRKPLIIGEMVHHTPEGDVVEPMALVRQRRLSSRESGITKKKFNFLVVDCPLCGELHEHGDGDGSRTPHCSDREPFSGEYYVIGADQPVVPATTPYPELKTRLRLVA